jgi:hypothetical protein
MRAVDAPASIPEHIASGYKRNQESIQELSKEESTAQLGSQPNMGRKELRQLRAHLLHIIKIMLIPAPVRQEDVLAIVRFVQDVQDPLQQEDVLHMLLVSMLQKRNALSLSDLEQGGGGVLLFLQLLSNPKSSARENIRVLSIKFLGLLLSGSKKQRRLFQRDVGYQSTTSLLQHFPLTLPVYSALLEAATGSYTIQMQPKASELITRASSLVIEIPQMLAILFNLLSSADNSIRHRALMDINLIMQLNTGIRQKYVDFPSLHPSRMIYAMYILRTSSFTF